MNTLAQLQGEQRRVPIGIFDSGIGGLVIARALRRALPAYDFLYLGDSLHVPYGPRSTDAIYTFTKASVTYLFDQGCELVILACNTASASALRRLQQTWLQDHYPGRRVLGVIVPTLEAAIDGRHRNFGLLGTAFTVNSQIYPSELQKIEPAIEFHSVASPLLVPIVESNMLDYAEPVLAHYLKPLLATGIDSLILGCTHYPLFKPLLKKMLPPDVAIISQDDLLPPKLQDYLRRHPDIDQKLTRNGRFDCVLTDVTPTYMQMGEMLFGEGLEFNKVSLPGVA